MSPAVLAATYEVSGNGRDSKSFINVDTERKVEVDQDNKADVNNDVTINLDTGRNRANDTVGGNVDIDTGNAEAGVSIDNSLNTNIADVDLCGGCAFSGDALIEGNGRDSKNDIELDSKSKVDLDQNNRAKVDNDVDITGNSGRNRANDTVGGDVDIDTGNVKVNPVAIWNTLNTNYARVSGGDNEGSLSARILGNARDSKNFINLDFESKIDLDQDNKANVNNDVTLDLDSGRNRANDTVGGLVDIDTGNIEAGVLVDTAANFNLADVEDCCLLDLDAKIAGNGRDSKNDIAVDLTDKLDVDQDNDLDCGGHDWWRKRGPRQILDGRWPWFDKGGDKCADVDITGNTGRNKANDTNGGGDGDPAIDTGDADVSVEVYNSGNVNEFGNADFDLPGGGGTSVDIDLDFGGLLELLQDLLGLLS